MSGFSILRGSTLDRIAVAMPSLSSLPHAPAVAAGVETIQPSAPTTSDVPVHPPEVTVREDEGSDDDEAGPIRIKPNDVDNGLASSSVETVAMGDEVIHHGSKRPIIDSSSDEESSPLTKRRRIDTCNPKEEDNEVEYLGTYRLSVDLTPPTRPEPSSSEPFDGVSPRCYRCRLFPDDGGYFLSLCRCVGSVPP